MSRLVNRHRETGKYYYLGSEQDMLEKMYELEEKQHGKIAFKDNENYVCPSCQTEFEDLWETPELVKYNYCYQCGQRIVY